MGGFYHQRKEKPRWVAPPLATTDSDLEYDVATVDDSDILTLEDTEDEEYLPEATG